MSQAISRRAVTKGAAWAVPIIAVASAAPAAAASGQCTVSGLFASIDLERDDGDSVAVHLYVYIGARPVCTGGDGELVVTATFTLTAPYTGWDASGDLSPGSGDSPGTYLATVGGSFHDAGDGYEVWFTAFKPQGSAPEPITFTLSAPGASPVTVTAFDAP